MAGGCGMSILAFRGFAGVRLEAEAIGAEDDPAVQIGRAHVRTPVTNAHLVCRLLLEKKKNINQTNNKQKRTQNKHNTTTLIQVQTTSITHKITHKCLTKQQ